MKTNRNEYSLSCRNYQTDGDEEYQTFSTGNGRRKAGRNAGGNEERVTSPRRSSRRRMSSGGEDSTKDAYKNCLKRLATCNGVTDVNIPCPALDLIYHTQCDRQRIKIGRRFSEFCPFHFAMNNLFVYREFIVENFHEPLVTDFVESNETTKAHLKEMEENVPTLSVPIKNEVQNEYLHFLKLYKQFIFGGERELLLLRIQNTYGLSSYAFFDSLSQKSDGTSPGSKTAILFF